MHLVVLTKAQTFR